MRRCPYCGRRHVSNRLIDTLWFVTIVLIGPALYTIIRLFT